MKWDFTFNPGYVVTWAALVVGLLWKLSAFVAEMRNLVARFGDHEERDDARFAAIDAQFRALHDRFDALKEQVMRTR
jgi:hypothetical protein